MTEFRDLPEPLDDERAELASAYLDGELDAAEVARAEADPLVMELIAVLGQVNVASIEPAPAAAREAAIAAAVGEFGAGRAAAEPIALDSLRRRRQAQRMRWVAGLAAAAAVGVVGIGILGRNTAHDDTTSASATVPPLAQKSIEAANPAATMAGSAGGAAPETTAAAAESAADYQSIPIIDSPEQLANYYGAADSAATAAPALTIEPLADQSPCAGDGLQTLGPIVYKGTDALAIRVVATGALRAVDASDCSLLAETGP